jgi:hypothetical protein
VTTEVQCQITQRQSTFWEFELAEGLERVHFVEKEEFCFTQRFAESLEVSDEHPVLLNYQAAWQQIYIGGNAPDPNRIVSLITHAIEPLLLGWRSAYSYLTATDPARMLQEGFGQLLSAPTPIARITAEVLGAEGVPFTVLKGQPPRWPRRALIAGTSFVVARDFRIEKLSPNKALERSRDG